MPRSAAAGPASSEQAPDYFTSFAALEAYFASPHPRLNRHVAPPPPLARSTARQRLQVQTGRVLVCHDYKGGYCERDDERGYTFQHWEAIDTFIYFSHHRVSCPPRDWIRAAHTHGVKILGTLILEHDNKDVVELVRPTPASSSSPANPSSTNPFSRLSTRYADYLVDLAVERGFDGWLVNVEVDLGIGEEKAFAREHARALVEWVRYFRGEMARRIEGAEVLWYDSITAEGKVAWQNQLNARNSPFFDAADGIFLNYWWRQPELASTASFLRQGGQARQSDVFFGIDVFGRGSYGGGGFESWRAVQAVQKLSSDARSASASKPFSTAVFAPGWTVEADSLGHSLTSPAGYARWLADDTYFWSHGAATPSVAIESARLDKERKEQRGIQRARQLAAALAPTASPLPTRLRIPPPFDYQAPLDPLPGTGPPQPLSAFSPTPRPVPCLDLSFYTNFSAGSGHAFFVQGKKVLDDAAGNGWTDAGFAFPQPVLAFHHSLSADRERDGVEATLVEHNAYEGARALQLTVKGGASEAAGVAKVKVPLCALELPALGTRAPPRLRLAVTWKETPDTGRAVEQVGPSIPPLLSFPCADSTLTASSSQATTRTHSNGWSSTSLDLSIDSASLSSSSVVHLGLALPLSSSFLIGSLAITPLSSQPILSLAPSNLRYEAAARVLRWDVDLAVPTTLSSRGLERIASPRLRYFHVFRLSPTGEAVYLGTTFDREFNLSGLPAGDSELVEVIVRGIDGDGQVRSEAAARIRIDNSQLRLASS
ncbi:hypothetical protein JCM10207_005150 [Rhodosporidiobolus poonsookiae]